MTFELLQTLTLILIDTVSIFLLIVVSSNSLKVNLNRWFVIMTLCLLGWVNFSYFGFTTQNTDNAILFYRLNWAFVSAFFFSAYVFYIEKFLNINKVYLRWILFFVSLSFIILSLFTDSIITGVNQQAWGNEIVFGNLNIAFNVFSVLVTGMFIYYFITRYVTLSKKEQAEVVYFLIGTFALIAFNLIFNVISPMFLNTAKFQTFGDFSSVIFLSFTAFAILRYRFLGVKVALTAFLISIIGMFLVLDIFLFSNSPLEGGIKVVILIFFVLISILLVQSVLTEIKQKEELQKANVALDKSRQRYIDLATEQKDIIDVMGHEIRTPLTAIIQELNIHKALLIPKKEDWLNDKVTKEERFKMLTLIFESLDTIDKASSHAVQLVNDMLETARLDKKRFELNYSEFDIAQEVETSVSIMSKTIESGSCNIKFHNKLTKPLLVEADRTRIREAVDALLSNAIKYHDPKKKICSINVTLDTDSQFFRIKITDNGIGIAKEDISKLGKKFMRLNPKTNDTLKRPGGTGLGLFVVKGIIDYHKGIFNITSDGIGKGSCFTIEVPLRKAR